MIDGLVFFGSRVPGLAALDTPFSITGKSELDFNLDFLPGLSRNPLPAFSGLSRNPLPAV
jgi:hypothetical protein